MPNDDVSKKARRLKAGGACVSCRKRKHRCDAARPQCLSCKIRGIDCQYPLTNVESFSVEQLEALVESRKRGAPDAQTAGSDVAVAAAGWQRELDLRAQGSSPASASKRSPVERPTSKDVAVTSSQGYLGDSSSFAFVTRTRPSKSSTELDDVDDPSLSLSRDQDFDDAEYAFPSRAQADELVDAYFERVHLLYPFVHSIQFRTQYESFWLEPHSVDISNSWMAILNIVFAYGCEFRHASARGNFLAIANPFVRRAREIILSLVFDSVDLGLVQAQLMLCHYLQGTHRLNDCWNLAGLMIRSAYALGLHIDPAEDQPISAIEREMRRRVFWGCTALDKTLSMKLGRPPSINIDDAMRIPWPAAVDDQYITDTAAQPRQPSQRPSRTAFFVHTAKMAPVNDIILKTLYFSEPRKHEANGALPCLSAQSRILSDAVRLDGQLRAWWNELPIHLRVAPEIPDGAGFARQRSVFLIRYLNMRTLLHRAPFLVLCKQAMEDEFLKELAIASSKICIATASKTVQLVYAQYNQQLLNSLWYNLHYMFTAMGVLLTVYTLDRSLQEFLQPLPDPTVLDHGMDFLRSASHISTLAGRYVKMLEPFCRLLAPQQYEFPLGTHQTHDPASTHALSIDATSIPDVHSQLSSMDYMDPDDLLFGAGIPQTLFNGDWSPYPDLY
ncbi:uncharacterized protein PV09_04099 [Verruconis gallopava]|uniref:Zn(2)-C6 fungal-type domain-containing protein n=1 Tax=Verruconis gallopava TaxID=253628 RepID=A0A0D1XQL7_9PEZI|nr:uncharacterized protein PV09_04099 [Verruconis gallopava]KIW04931.1 hypothetical protein PV09_04099 [Verruconis gallopava]